MNLSSVDIGRRISKRLNELGMTQTQLCNNTGLSKTAISNYVNGNRVPDTGTSVTLAKALDVDMEWLLTGENMWHDFHGSFTSIDTENNSYIKEKPLLELLVSNFNSLSKGGQDDLVNYSAVLLQKEKEEILTFKVAARGNSSAELKLTREQIKQLQQIVKDNNIEDIKDLF